MSSMPSSWRRPVRFAGWLTVVGTLFAAMGVTSSSVVSCVLYVVSAAMLGLLLVGSLAPRRLLKLPDGPLGDGALLLGWLLLLLVAGAVLPRGPDLMASSGPSAPPVATPVFAPTPTRAPSPSPSPGP